MGGFSPWSVRRGRARRWLVSAAVLAVAAACSGDDGGAGAGGPAPGSAGSGSDERPGFAFTVTATDVQPMSAQPPAFPPEVAAKVKAGLDAYLADGVIEPLEGGGSPGGLEQSFTAGALAELTASAADRAAVLEDGALTGDVRQDRANARLTALTAPDGRVALVTAQVELAHTVDTGDADVAVVRTGELVLVDDGGSWKVDAFDMRTSRDTT